MNVFGGISSYNLLNYLLPGCLYGAALYLLLPDIQNSEHSSDGPIDGTITVVLATVCFYFIGMSFSRLGSLLGFLVRMATRDFWKSTALDSGTEDHLNGRYKSYYNALANNSQNSLNEFLAKRLEMLAEARDAYRTGCICFFFIAITAVCIGMVGNSCNTESLPYDASIYCSVALVSFVIAIILFFAAAQQHAYVCAHINAANPTGSA